MKYKWKKTPWQTKKSKKIHYTVAGKREKKGIYVSVLNIGALASLYK